MVEDEKETVIVEEPAPRVERETTVISTGGGGGAIAAIVVVLLLGLLAFLYLGGYLGRAADGTDINVNVDVPKVEVPDIDVNLPPPSQPENSNKQ